MMPYPLTAAVTVSNSMSAMFVFLSRLSLACLPLCTAGLMLCASGANGQTATSIYTCTDAQGRQLTSDRPILECIDREQRELGSSGVVRRVIPPAITPAERAAREERERQIAVDREREREAMQRDQALFTRYPNKAAHEAGRAQALEQTQVTIHAAEQRIAELTEERKALDDEMEFYRKDPSRAPTRLTLAIRDNTQEMVVQLYTIKGQRDERDRIDARFDDEDKRLQPLWKATTRSKTASAAAAPDP